MSEPSRGLKKRKSFLIGPVAFLFRHRREAEKMHPLQQGAGLLHTRHVLLAEKGFPAAHTALKVEIDNKI